MTDGKGTTVLECNEMMSELYVKVSFKNSMSEMQLNELKEDWKEFIKQVDKTIENIEGVPFS